MTGKRRTFLCAHRKEEKPKKETRKGRTCRRKEKKNSPGAKDEKGKGKGLSRAQFSAEGKRVEKREPQKAKKKKKISQAKNHFF